MRQMDTNADEESLKFREIIQYEKSSMNKIRFIMNYRIVPGYAVACAVLLTIICITMSADETKYTPLAIVLFGIIGLLSVLLLASGPFVRKKEIQMEMSRYDFEKTEIEPAQRYEFSDEGISVHFDKNGMTVNDIFFWYNHITARVNTYTWLHRIIITLIFFLDEENYFEIPLNGDTINMVKQFEIKLENQDALDYIVHHKEDAFKKIYIKGHV